MTSEQPADDARRLPAGSLAWLASWAVLAALAGWLVGTGLVRAYATGACGVEQYCDELATTGYLVGGILLWLVAMVSGGTVAMGDGGGTEPAVVAGRAVLAAFVGLALLGAGLSNGAFHAVPLRFVPPLALLAWWGERWGGRRWHRERAERRKTESGPVPAGSVPADAVPPDADGLALLDALERLAALRREGSLSELEFGLAKARLLGDGG